MSYKRGKVTGEPGCLGVLHEIEYSEKAFLISPLNRDSNTYKCQADESEAGVQRP